MLTIEPPAVFLASRVPHLAAARGRAFRYWPGRRRPIVRSSTRDRAPTKEKSLFPGTSKTGATGLEPATSGVTGRYGAAGHAGYDAELPAGAGNSSNSEPAVTGYDRLAPGTACVAYVWWLWACFDNVATFSFDARALVALMASGVQTGRSGSTSAVSWNPPTSRKASTPPTVDRDAGRAYGRGEWAGSTTSTVGRSVSPRPFGPRQPRRSSGSSRGSARWTLREHRSTDGSRAVG
jgi:hypothetical protein